jgi:hypothetical protein
MTPPQRPAPAPTQRSASPAERIEALEAMVEALPDPDATASRI